MILVFGSSSLFSQISKFRGYEFAITTTDDSGSWADWSDFEETNVLIVMDNNISRITVYSEEKQVYDITATEEETEDGTVDDSGDQSWTFICVDQDGLECRVKMMIRYSLEDSRTELYVIYDDISWVYKVFSVDEE